MTGDLTGRVYGLLTVLGRTGPRYECQCACGHRIAVFRGNLVQGRSQSCGCQGMGGRRRDGVAQADVDASRARIAGLDALLRRGFGRVGGAE